MELFYPPNDSTAPERENKKWREVAHYDLAEDLFFQLRDVNWPALLEAHAQSWHISAVRVFHNREADRGDGKYPWTSLETKLDNIVRGRFTSVRRVTLPGILAAGRAAYSFDCVGRLIRRYTPQNDNRGGLSIHGPKLGRRPRFASLTLPIPTPAEHARRKMERFRNSVRDSYFRELDAGPGSRQFLAERLAHSQRIVTAGARLADALEYRPGYFRLTPTDIGSLWGSLDYFQRCWREFHEAETPPVQPLAAAVSAEATAPADPTGAYVAALRQVPVNLEWVNDSPRYYVPLHLAGYDEYSAETRPLRQAFEAALPTFKKRQMRALRTALGELLAIDRAGLTRRKEQYEAGKYPLKFLPEDYPALRFEVEGAPADQPDRFKWMWAAPVFFGILRTLLHYKQLAARVAYDQLSATLGEAGWSKPAGGAVPATPIPPINTAVTAKETAQLNLSKRSRTPRQPKVARLAPGISADEVKTLLTAARLGSDYRAPGEWAAALRALMMEGVLLHDDPAPIHRWAVANLSASASLIETIKPMWRDEWNEADQFTNRNQKTVFRMVASAASSLLTNSKLKNTCK